MINNLDYPMVRNFWHSIDISVTGLRAQRERLDNIASNIANVQTTRTEEGGPYRRRITTFAQNDQWYRFDKLLNEEKLKLGVTDKSHLIPEEAALLKDRLTGVNAETEISQEEPNMVFDPTHPDANGEGYVAYPNINIVAEMTDLIAAQRAYEANVTVMGAAKGMAKNALMI